MVHGEEDAEDVEHVVAEGTLYQRAGGLVQVAFGVGCQGAREERWTQVDRYAREPIEARG